MGLLIDLRVAELANALGLRSRLLNLKRLLLAGLAGLTLAIPALGFITARLFSWISTDVPASALLVPLVALLSAMSLAGILLAEIVGKYRDAVCLHPNRNYFRSLDIPIHRVHLVYVVPRLGAALGFWLLTSAGIIIGLLSAEGPGSWLPIAVVLLGIMPLTCVLLALAYSLFRAGQQYHRPVKQPLLLALFAAVGVVLGLIGGQLLSALGVGIVTEQDLDAPSSTVPGHESAGMLIAVAIPLLLILFGVCLTRFLRLRNRSFLIHHSAIHPVPLLRMLPLIVAWPALLWAQRHESWRRKAESRCIGVLLSLVTALLVLTAQGLPVLGELLTGRPETLDQIRIFLGFGSALLGVSIAEFTIGDIGRYRMGPHLRHAVELGAPAGLTAVIHAIALLGPALLCGLLTTIAAAVALGGPWAFPLLLTLGGSCACLVADRLVPPPRAADGTAGEGIATAMAGVLLASLPAGWLVAAPQAAIVLTPLTVTVLLLGGLWCTWLNLTRMSA